jgi:hypothetical protein
MKSLIRETNVVADQLAKPGTLLAEFSPLCLSRLYPGGFKRMLTLGSSDVLHEVAQVF